MYSTVMKATAMIDRTEQERLLIIFHCAEKYYNLKGSKQSGTKRLCASRAQNDALEAVLSHRAQAQRSGVRIERSKYKGKRY